MAWFGPGDGDALSGDGSGHEEGARLDAVWNHGVLGTMEFLDPLDFDALGARSGDPSPHGCEKGCQIDHLGFLGGAFDDGRSFGEDGGHHDVSGAQNGWAVTAAQVDAGAGQLIGG